MKNSRNSVMLGLLMESFDAVKVFSATKAADREALGDKVTAWLRDNRDYTVQRAIVSQSSDASFHCLSMVFFLKRTAAT